MTKAKQVDELDDTMRVLSTGTCETLSGSSKLTYHIGSMPDGEIYLRVHSNTGGGFFSQEWISLRDILTALKKRPDGKPITSILLNPLFRGRSANTPGFMMAVLLHEKVVRSMQGNPQATHRSFTSMQTTSGSCTPPPPRRHRPRQFGSCRSVWTRNPMCLIDFSARHDSGFRHDVRDKLGRDCGSGGTPEKRLGFFGFLAQIP